MKYYVTEVQNRGSRRAATAIEAETLREAMNKAEELQSYEGTRLEIGTEIDSNGFLVDVIASNDCEEWQSGKNVLLVECKFKGDIYQAYGNFKDEGDIFDPSDVVIMCNQKEMTEFGEVWSGRELESADIYITMLCGYLNENSSMEDYSVDSRIAEFKQKEQDHVLMPQNLHTPKFFFNDFGKKYELFAVFKSSDGYESYYAIDDDEVALTDQKGNVLTTVPEFFENSLYKAISDNSSPLYLSEGGKGVYKSIRGEILDSELEKISPERREEYRKAGIDDGRLKLCLENGWAAEDLAKGYVISVGGCEVDIPDALQVQRIDDLGFYPDDTAASKQAAKDGIKFIHNIPGIERGVYVDTPENRKICRKALAEHPEYRIENILKKHGNEQHWKTYIKKYGNPTQSAGR